jgi:hypothetical protein
MPTLISGNPLTPTPGSAVSYSTPADGDAGNATSVNQAFQPIADRLGAVHETLVVRKPVAAVYTPQLRMRDSAGTGRAVLVDHNGFPMDAWIANLAEDFRAPQGASSITQTGAGTTGSSIAIQTGAVGAAFRYVPGWGSDSNANGNTLQWGALASTPNAPVAMLQATTGAGNANGIVSPFSVLPDGRVVVGEWIQSFSVDMLLEPIEIAYGFRTLTATDPTPTVAPAVPQAYFFLNPIAGGGAFANDNWQVVYSPGGGGATQVVDTGVLANNAAHRMRIELHTALSAEGGRALFFFDDALVANLTPTPVVNNALYWFMGSARLLAGGLVANVMVSALRCRTNLFAALPNL